MANKKAAASAKSQTLELKGFVTNDLPADVDKRSTEFKMEEMEGYSTPATLIIQVSTERKALSVTETAFDQAVAKAGIDPALAEQMKSELFK